MSLYYQDEHVTLYHGDCREIIPTLDGPFQVITDPPYAIDSNGAMLGFVSPNWEAKATHSRGYADHDRAAFATLIADVFAGLLERTTPGDVHAAFCGNRTFHQMVTAIEDAGFQPLDVLVFGSQGVAKSQTTLAPAHELASLFRTPGGKPQQINPTWTTSNRHDLPKSRSMETAHVTTKPLSWMRRMVEIIASGRTVFDPFAGSGTTLVAAREAGLPSVGIEQDEAYCELIAKRLAQGTFDFNTA